jgi:thioredoxin reductase (NADPH)
MNQHGTKLIRGCVPDNIEATQDDRRLVTWTLDGQTYCDVFDTVLMAVGRYADTSRLNLEAVQVKLDKSGKILCTPDDRTSNPSVYAIGDCVLGRPELTPTAIQCGQLLAKRLFAGSTLLMDYEFVATCVFTPIEYGCIGYSEEDAKKTFGEEDIKVYHSIFKPLEWNFLESRGGEDCYAKVIVYQIDNRVVGLHYLGPNAGEVTQGYAVAMRMGMTKDQLDITVGIHPTTSEVPTHYISIGTRYA